MKSKIRGVVLCMILVIFVSLFTGCYDRREVDDLAYVIAVGLDKGTTNFLRLTLQLAVPLAVGGSGGGGGGSEGGGGKSTEILTVEAPTIYVGLNMVNNSISKQLNLSHAKVIVFSEELAREGVGKYLHAIIRGREFRPNTDVAVARGSAEDYIKSIKPMLEANPAKYYEFTFSNWRYTAFSSVNQVHDFYFDTESFNREAVASLVGVGKYNDSKEFTNQNSTYKEKGDPYPLEGDYKAGDIPKVGGLQGEVMGLAVFRGSKMVGELDGDQASYYLIATGEYSHAYWSIPDPKHPDTFVVLNISKGRRPSSKAEMVDGKPKISLDAKLEGDFISIQSGENYEQDYTTFERYAEGFIKDRMLKFLYKTAGEYNSDICGFGKKLQTKFLTWEDWKNFDWLKRYKDATFDVNISLRVRRPGLMIRTEMGSGE